MELTLKVWSPEKTVVGKRPMVLMGQQAIVF